MTKPKQATTLEIVILTDVILEYFDRVVEGVASDLAYFETLGLAEDYLKSKLERKKFVEYLEFVFNMDNADFTKILKEYKHKLQQTKSMLWGEEDASK